MNYYLKNNVEFLSNKRFIYKITILENKVNILKETKIIAQNNNKNMNRIPYQNQWHNLN